SIMALGMLVAVGAALDGMGDFKSAPRDGGPDGFGGHDGFDGRGDNHDFGGHRYYDWLNPGGYTYTYSWGYPSYYSSYWYPTYTYTYPTYYYTTPVVYPTYTTYYDPVVYDPWYATNVYGWGGASYYYSSSWSWSTHGGYFF
ncbi:MAG: hypothetical protein PHY05_05785, partial [Methanothrix sp.]|nr:hypothetical protein [Methanothrix sp.]